LKPFLDQNRKVNLSAIMNLLRYDRMIDQMNTKCGLAQESRSKVSIAIPEQARKPVVYQRQLLQAGVNL